MQVAKRLDRNLNMFRFFICVVTIALSACGSRREIQDPTPIKQQIASSCGESTIEIQSPISADELFIDSHYLKFLAGTTTDRGHILEPDLARVVRYVIEKGFLSFETDMQFDSDLYGITPGKITRISVKPAQNPACKAFRYTWWELPELRKLGLDPDHCVAVEKIEKPTASTRILAQTTKVARIADEREWYALWRIEVTAGTTNQFGELNPSIRLVDHVAYTPAGGNYGWSGWSWGCSGNNVRAKALNSAISGKGNPMLHSPKIVVMHPSVPSIQETSATDADIANLSWLERERCAGGSNTVNAEGSIWIKEVYIDSVLRIALHVLRGNTLIVAPMPIEFDRALFNNESLLHYRKGFVVNLTRGFKNDESRRLVVFDKDLKHVATWKLSAEQRKSLIPPDPASTNWCRDPKHDQFQRTNFGQF